MIIPVGGLDGGRPDNSLPGGQGGHPSQPIYHPGHPDHGLPPYPDQGLPGGGGSGGRPSHPIYHPGHPDHGLPAHPDQGLPPQGSGGSPSHPIHIPGVPDQGLPEGQPIPDNELPPPAVPPQYQDDLVIGVKAAGSTEWTFTAYDTSNQPDQGLPPHPAPKRGRR
jgi:hypothetical protein